MTSARVFISTSIPYVNGTPHVGFAWELVIADALARYHRARGASVRFLTGTDDNSLKNVQAAERARLPVASFVRSQGDRFHALAERLGLSNDDFIRTASDPRHAPAVERLWRACDVAGDVYRSTYRGAYCVGCEQFYAPGELAGDRCPEHDAPLAQLEEPNYFFRLSRQQSLVDHLLASKVLAVYPETYLAETYGWVQRGLGDFSISRSEARAAGWGIFVPGDPSQIVYVWFDALTNYLSALDYADGGQLFAEYWRGADRRIHVIGKNVTRFHCIYWPAILSSAGLPAPTEVVVHGFLTVDGRKIGKSLGNGVDPFELVERFGRDRLRHYLLRHFALGHDADFSVAALIRASDSELGDQLGNLLQRVLVLIEKHAGGVVPSITRERTPLSEAAPLAADDAARELERGATDRASAAVFGFIEAANAEISRTEPWLLARRLAHGTFDGTPQQTAAALSDALGDAARALLWIAGLLEPLLPDTAGRIAEALGAPLPSVYETARRPAWNELGHDARIRRGEVLFPRLGNETSPLAGVGHG
jgi:methionyl-tRNA synthetase